MRIDGKLIRIAGIIEAALEFIAPLGEMSLISWVTHQPSDYLKHSGSYEAVPAHPSTIAEEE